MANTSFWHLLGVKNLNCLVFFKFYVIINFGHFDVLSCAKLRGGVVLFFFDFCTPLPFYYHPPILVKLIKSTTPPFYYHPPILLVTKNENINFRSFSHFTQTYRMPPSQSQFLSLLWASWWQTHSVPFQVLNLHGGVFSNHALPPRFGCPAERTLASAG